MPIILEDFNCRLTRLAIKAEVLLLDSGPNECVEMYGEHAE